MSVGYKLKQTSAEVQAAIDKIIALQPGSLDDIGIYIHDSSYWTEHNDFVPEQGALVAYTDTAKFKMGDGVTAVANLDFLDADLQTAVKFTAQILTAEQKAQARENIGAGTYSKPTDGIPASDLEEGVIPDVSDFVTGDEMDAALEGKVDKIPGKGLSTEDYTTAEKQKLAGLQNYDDTALAGRVTAIEGKIPSQASAQNQLADKNFVNSSISTATAEFKGTYNSLAELQQVAANANDYGYVVSTDAAGNTIYNRYKYVDGTGWVFEYALNNSSFTAAQWAAINSGITSAELQQMLDDISEKYEKPENGIPASDLEDGVIPDVPAMSTNIANDASSNNKTVTPKAVVDYAPQYLTNGAKKIWTGTQSEYDALTPANDTLYFIPIEYGD